MKSFGLDLAEGTNISNFTVPVLASPPASPNSGEVFYLIGTGLVVYNGTAWNKIHTNPKKVHYQSVTTDANSAWSANFTGFATIDYILAVPVRNSSNISSQSFCTLASYTTTTATGYVVNSATVSIGGDGLVFSGSGIQVMVRVEGDPA